MAEKTDVVQFMVIRAPTPADQGSWRRGYVRDTVLGPGGFEEADLFSVRSDSVIGKLVYEFVFCQGRSTESPVNHLPVRSGPDIYALRPLLAEVVETLERYTPPCPNTGEGEGLRVEHLKDLTWFTIGETFYLLPDRLDRIKAPLAPALPAVLALLREAAGTTPSAALDSEVLRKRIGVALGGNKGLHEIVFDNDGRYAPDFAQTKRALFDTLYTVYVLRRVLSVSLEEVVDGLRALHALEALAVDDLVELLVQKHGPRGNQADLVKALAAAFPALRGWNLGGIPAGMPLIKTAEDAAAYLAAVPVVHPLFARLRRFKKPFNSLRPIGVGDLKVVKQWLCGYNIGEIAHVDNVLQSEKRTRVHRHLEKNEETSSYSTEQQEEVQKDTQSTDRFELKREAETVVKSDLAVNAGLNVNVNYQGGTYAIVSTVSGAFAYTRSQSDQSKVAANFAREVVDKAVKRVQTRTSMQRTSTRLFETEETNTHKFDNINGTRHVSGIYRWLDKKYKAQLYNYGKRMMFEFILPEPAAFLVESRLRAFEATADVPRPPQKPKPVELPDWLTKLDPADITELKFNELRRKYDLSEFTYLPPKKQVEFVDRATDGTLFSAEGFSEDMWVSKKYDCRLNAKNYFITKFIIDGWAEFSGWLNYGEDNKAAPKQINSLQIHVAGQRVFGDTDNSIGTWFFSPLGRANKHHVSAVAQFAPMDADDVTLTLGCIDISKYSLSFKAEVTLSPGALLDLQTRIYRKILDVEQKKVDDQNRLLEQAYEGALSTYRNRLAQLRASAVNDLLQGRSEAANRQVIVEELKRQCLAMLTKEFDDNPRDDLLTNMEAMGVRGMKMRLHRFKVEELPDATAPVLAKASFEVVEEAVAVPAPDLDISAFKGRYVQFLEQAFEWQQLAWIFYPYFWATPPKWVEMMNRSDDADPNFSAFLRAGSARVLLAVTPAYDEAVLHYIATGQPWDGGPAPVIGDPLFIPLHEELRKQQDDIANATPEGEPWPFTVPTALVYLENSSTELPPDECP